MVFNGKDSLAWFFTTCASCSTQRLSFHIPQLFVTGKAENSVPHKKDVAEHPHFRTLLIYFLVVSLYTDTYISNWKASLAQGFPPYRFSSPITRFNLVFCPCGLSGLLLESAGVLTTDCRQAMTSWNDSLGQFVYLRVQILFRDNCQPGRKGPLQQLEEGGYKSL